MWQIEFGQVKLTLDNCLLCNISFDCLLRNISFDSTVNSKELEIPKSWKFQRAGNSKERNSALIFIYFKDFIETKKNLYSSRLRFFNVKCIYKEAF